MWLLDRVYDIGRKYAPWWDRFDSMFAIVIVCILLGGYATFVEQLSLGGFYSAFRQFAMQSGLIATLTGFTAIIALYRLRHRPNKTRPAVREDFDNYDGEEPTDFGLRNFGPGPALYLQAAVEVTDSEVHDDDDESDFAVRFEVHDKPIHLQEGDFASLVLERDDSWLQEVAAESETKQLGESGGEEQSNSPMVNLHYTYVSQSGAREPTDLIANRDDTCLLEDEDLIDRNGDPRQIELSKVVESVDINSPDG